MSTIYVRGSEFHADLKVGRISKWEIKADRDISRYINSISVHANFNQNASLTEQLIKHEETFLFQNGMCRLPDCFLKLRFIYNSLSSFNFSRHFIPVRMAVYPEFIPGTLDLRWEYTRYQTLSHTGGQFSVNSLYLGGGKEHELRIRWRTPEV